MKINKIAILGVLVLAVVLAAPMVEARAQHQQQHMIFLAMLRGSNQIPPVTTNGHGIFIARLSRDGQSISYMLIVTGLKNVTMAHIHIGNSSTNGPIVVTLFHSETPVPRVNGILAKGTFTASDLSGPLKGMTLNDLLNAIMNGNAYVNVHTTQHPAGEIRGQVVTLGKGN